MERNSLDRLDHILEQALVDDTGEDEPITEVVEVEEKTDDQPVLENGVKVYYAEGLTIKEVIIFPKTVSVPHHVDLENLQLSIVQTILALRSDDYLTQLPVSHWYEYRAYVEKEPVIVATFPTEESLVKELDKRWNKLTCKRREMRREGKDPEGTINIDGIFHENGNKVIKLKIKKKKKLEISDDEIEKKFDLSVRSFRSFIQKHLYNHELILRFYDKASDKPSDILKLLCGLVDNRKNVITAYIPDDIIERNITNDLARIVSGFKNFKVDPFKGELHPYPVEFEYDGKKMVSSPRQKYTKDLEILVAVKFLKKSFKKWMIKDRMENFFKIAHTLLRANNPLFTITVFKDVLWWAFSTLDGEKYHYHVREFIDESSHHKNPAVVFLLAKALYYEDEADCDLDLKLGNFFDKDFRRKMLSRIKNYGKAIASDVAREKLRSLEKTAS